jgi:hypothetical protein
MRRTKLRENHSQPVCSIEIVLLSAICGVTLLSATCGLAMPGELAGTDNSPLVRTLSPHSERDWPPGHVELHIPCPRPLRRLTWTWILSGPGFCRQWHQVKKTLDKAAREVEQVKDME